MKNHIFKYPLGPQSTLIDGTSIAKATRQLPDIISAEVITGENIEDIVTLEIVIRGDADIETIFHLGATVGVLSHLT